jgi:hypothetical protein
MFAGLVYESHFTQERPKHPSGRGTIAKGLQGWYLIQGSDFQNHRKISGILS